MTENLILLSPSFNACLVSTPFLVFFLFYVSYFSAIEEDVEQHWGDTEKWTEEQGHWAWDGWQGPWDGWDVDATWDDQHSEMQKLEDPEGAWPWWDEGLEVAGCIGSTTK